MSDTEPLAIVRDTEEPWTDPEILEELYWDLEMSLEQIGGVLGVHWSTVHQNMKWNDIPRRDVGRGNKITLDKEELRRLRVDEGLSLNDMGQELGVSHVTVLKHLKDHGIGDYGD